MKKLIVPFFVAFLITSCIFFEDEKKTIENVDCITILTPIPYSNALSTIRIGIFWVSPIIIGT